MSYPRLVGYADHSQAKSEKLSDKIVFFDIERGTAKMANRRGVIDGRTVFVLVHEGALARFPDAVRHHVHGAIERNLHPLLCPRCAILHFRFAPRMSEQLITSRDFRAKSSMADRAFR